MREFRADRSRRSRRRSRRGVDAAAERLGGLDGLVNNAAIATGIGGKTFDEIDIETWDRVMARQCPRHLARDARRGAASAPPRHGKIVNIASDTALWGAPRLLHYVASKGAIIAMTRSLARELGPDGVAVNAIAPGLTIVEATEYVPEERHSLYVENRAMTPPANAGRCGRRGGFSAVGRRRFRHRTVAAGEWRLRDELRKENR